MSEWVVRAFAAGVLLSLAALAAERAAGWLARPRRWVWCVAMAASLALPAVGAWLPGLLPAPTGDAVPASLEWLAPAPGAPDAASPSSAARPLEALGLAWMAASALMLCAMGWTALRLRAVRRACTPAVVDGARVLVSGHFGPAVLGLRRPEVVIPARVLGAPAGERALVLRHEREHAEADDPWILLLSMLAVAAMPWNPALWWQQRRLRLAVEIDCDTRVLAGGASRRAYGAALLHASQGAASALAPAWGEPKSHLERRLLAMTAPQPRNPVLRAAPVAVAALCAALAACEVAGGPSTVAPPLLARGPGDPGQLEVVTAGSPNPSAPDLGMRYGWHNLNIRVGPGTPPPARMPFHPVVTQVDRGGAAERAGLLPGDTIVSVNGRDGREKRIFPARAPGRRYAVRISRAGERRDVTLVLGPARR